MHLNRLLPLIFLTAAALLLPAAGDPPPTPASAETEAELAAAFTRRLESAPGVKSLTFDLFTPELDAAFTSPDGKTAVLWLALRDDSGRLLATEPGLALAVQGEDGWQTLLPGDPGWDAALAALPAGMLPLELSPAPAGVAADPKAVTTALTGYYLPYAAGTARWLEGSIFHFSQLPPELAYLGYPSCLPETCRYAYDFTDSDHFPLLASKDGYVLASRDSCLDGSETCANYIVLRSAGGAPYQIYLHLAHGTIPDKLTAGTAVKRGQYLGDSDDTGYSTSQHVHFMVTSDIWLGSGYNDYYWGHSIDIRFADVAINGGIPRNCYEVTRLPIYDGATECLGNKADPRNPANDWFVSGNVGAYPPTGALTRPAASATVASGDSPIIDVSATASDDVRVTAVRMVAKLNGQWVEIGPKQAGPGPYDWDVDLCAAGPLNGPVEVALRAWDHEGNVSPALAPRTIQVDHACPPPTSQMMAPESFASTAVRLNWTAAAAGAGLGGFEIQWRPEPGAWNAGGVITALGDQRSTWFAGQPGASYAFRLRALDANGQPEAWPAGDAAETTVPALPAACDPDGFEPDDTPVQAFALGLGEPAQRNLCAAGDPDWFRVTLGDGTSYAVTARSVSGGAAVRLSVYAADGVSELASGTAPGPGQNAALIFRPPAGGEYWLRIDPWAANLFGTQAEYTVMVDEAWFSYLPLLMR